MPKYAHPDVLDSGLNQIKSAANQQALLSNYSLGDSYATVFANRIASVAMASADFTLSSSGNNRVLTTAAGKTANATANTNQYDQGTATGGSAATLVDSGKAFGVNAHANRAVVITGGTGSGQRGRVVSNTATTLTFAAGTFGTAPDATSTYKIVDDLHIAFLDTTNSKVLWVTDESTDQTIASGNPIDFPQSTYTNQQPT